MSRPSFYAHFPTVDHVLYEWAWRLALEVVRTLEGAMGLRATLDRLVEALIDAEQAVGDVALFREMISIFVRRTAQPGLDGAAIPLLGDLMQRFARARAAGELRAGMEPERAARLCLSDTVGHATPDGVRNLIQFTKNVIAGTGATVGIDWHGHNDRGVQSGAFCHRHADTAPRWMESLDKAPVLWY